MMIGPRMHLHLLLAQSYDPAYAASIGGIFNIATSLAHFKAHVELQAEFDAAQDLLVRLIEGNRPPDNEESTQLRNAFNLADQWISIQNTALLTRAISFVNKETGRLRQRAQPHVAGKTAADQA